MKKYRMYSIPIRTPGLEPAAHFTVAHAPSHSEKRSVVMTLEDRSHGGHRAVANYFYEGKNENFEGSSNAALLPC